ncbi:MAG: hypothetical protein Q9219_006923 [cf. Caloplaca sp. 3 TL-2023]
MEYSRSSSNPLDGQKALSIGEKVVESPSSYSASAAYSSSSLPSLSEQSDRRPRKRKREKDPDWDLDAHISRRKRCYSANYHSLFNDAIQNLHVSACGTIGEDLHPSQVGISTWSPQEKDQLIQCIARRGRDNLPAIAAQVGTKSELEVHVYLQLLQEASIKQRMFGRTRSLISTADIPAAVEISEQCCAALDQAADALATLQQKHEERVEKKKHGDLWELDEKVAEWVHQRLLEGEEGRTEIRNTLPAAEILDLSSLLKLSANIFMNSGDSEYNYRSFISGKDKPSMLYTAFEDIHGLFLSITKRVIQSSLFFSMSRLRATQSSNHSHQRAVKKTDVLAALNVLGMKHGAKDFWVKLPRRNRLRIFDRGNVADQGKAMDYNEVEEVLSRGKLAAGTDAFPSDRIEDREKLLDYAAPSVSGSDFDSTASDSSAARDLNDQGTEMTDLYLPGEQYGEETDTYLEHLDQAASRKEEVRLWEMLGKDPPQDLSADNPAIPVEKPRLHRRNRDDIDDWRKWVDFKPGWEAYDVRDLDEHLSQNRRRMQIRPAERMITKDDGRRGHGHRNYQESSLGVSRQNKTDGNNTIDPSDPESGSSGGTTRRESLSEDESSASEDNVVWPSDEPS